MITLEHVKAELEREMAVRQRIYPQWIAIGKIKRETAEHRIACIKLAIYNIIDLIYAVEARHKLEQEMLALEHGDN